MSSDDNNIVVKALGQTGYYFELGDLNILIDPYLSDYVQKKEGDELKRLIPVPVKPEEFNKVDWLLITHDHIDHCDPETIVPLINKFPGLKIVIQAIIHSVPGIFNVVLICFVFFFISGIIAVNLFKGKLHECRIS